jgi:translocation and assembly module TamB
MARTASPAAPPPHPHRRWPLVLAAVLATLLVAVAGTLVWLWASPAGTAQALRHIPGLQAQDVRGRLGGGPFAAGRLAWQGSGWQVVVEGLQWRDARWQLRPHAGAWLGLTLTGLQARRVSMRRTAPAKPAATPAPPADLQLPLALAAPHTRLGAFELEGQPPLTQIQASVVLGAQAGAQHGVEALSLLRDGLRVDGGHVRIGTRGPLPVEAQLALSAAAPGDQGPAWQAQLKAAGPLQRLDLRADLQAEAGRGSVQASVAPFAPWPLRALALQLQELDLSVLSAAWPQTRLSGRAALAQPQSAAALALRVELRNPAAGAWDAGRLPLRQVQVVVRGRPGDPQALDFEALQAQLGTHEPAGSVTGTGRWRGRELALQLRLDNVRPARLDRRLPAVSLAGPVQALLQGLAVPGRAAAPAAGAAELRGRLEVDLAGRHLRQGGPPARLAAQADLLRRPDGSVRIGVQRLQAQAGRAQADAAGTLHRDAATPDWHVQVRGTLQRFDPGVWWPAMASPRGSALNGRWHTDLTWLAQPAAALPARLRGEAAVTLARSTLAGLPLQGRAALKNDAGTAEAGVHVVAAGNRMDAQGRLGTAAPQWQLKLDAPRLGGLAPLRALLAPLLGDLARWLPQTGAVSADATLQGRWPALHTQGQFRVRGLRAPAWEVQRAQARWTLSGNRPHAPLQLELDAAGLAQAQRRVETLGVDLRGSLAAHALQARAATALRPPAWTEALARPHPSAATSGPDSAAGPGGSALRLQARGRWQAGAAGGGTWHGHIVEARAAEASAAAGTAAWAAAEGIDASLRWDGAGRLREAGLAPGRLALFGGTVRWRHAAWQAPAEPDGPPRIDLSLQIDPLPVAPLLARLQPQQGWQGDLALAGHAEIHTGARFQADVAIERHGGDLALVLAGTRRALELQQLRLALTARDGVWTLSQAVAGERAGRLQGRQQVQAAPAAPWPDADAPLQGQLQFDAPDLAVWAAWLPAGWRLGGRMQAGLTLDGRAGAPRFGGRITGAGLLVRNLFQGVHLREGRLAVSLQGDRAAIDELVFHGGGAGTLRITGDARFNGPAQARLRAVAQRFRVLDRVDRRVDASGEARLTLGEGRLALAGRLMVDRGLIEIPRGQAAAGLDGDVIVVNRPARSAMVLEAGPGGERGAAFGGGAELDLHVDLGDELRIQGRGLAATLQGRLHVTDAADEQPAPGRSGLQVSGLVRVREGSYTAYGQDLAIDRGTLQFTGEPANPLLNVRALRADIDRPRVGVAITGRAVDPRVRLYSEPDMPEVDTLTWLVLGHAPTGLGRDDTALLQRAALSLLAGEDASDGGLAARFGLDELSVSRAEEGGQNPAGSAVVSVGKQLSRRLFIGYERALAGTGGTWEMIYRTAGRVMLRAQAGADDAVDAIWTWRWE